MKSGQLGRLGAATVLAIAAAEVLIMISPFAGFFYARLRFEPLLGLLSKSAATAWLDGFFLSHSAVTSSWLLEAHRKLGFFLFVGGLLGFLVSAGQVYGKKLLRRGVAKGLLYRLVRHPQYLCLGIAGYGLVVSWPRFLLLGVWVTMMFLYAGLARFEEARMEERFGDEYRGFAATRGSFLPGSPVRRLFERTFGRLRPRALGWATAYAVSLALAFGLGFALRSYARGQVAIRVELGHQAVVVSVWPKPDEWVAGVFEAALSDPRVRDRVGEARGGLPVVATILPPRYGMKGMYYKRDPGAQGKLAARSEDSGSLCGVDPEKVEEPVEVVFSRAEKPYKMGLGLDEALDASVRLTPLVVARVRPATGTVETVHVPLPQNVWGPNVLMPIL